jgi:hypothetical protein
VSVTEREFSILESEVNLSGIGGTGEKIKFLRDGVSPVQRSESGRG